MCGLIGFSGEKSYDYKHIRFLLFWNSIERGVDATGIFTPKSGVVKDNVSARSFITNKKQINKISLDNNLIGHVRAKTVGVNSVKNAHPFEYDNIVLAHNGTLQNHHQLIQMYQLNYHDYDVDSQVLAKCVYINTKYDDRTKILEQYTGAAALLWYDKNENCMYAYHDKERPLFYGYINKTEMYISSIRESLEAIFCEDIKAFDTSVLYKIINGKIVSTEKYVNKVPEKTNYIEIILADIKDLVKEKKKKKSWFTSKKQNISGIEIKDFMPDHAKGYWIMCDRNGFLSDNSMLNKKNELLYIDRWYYSLGKAKGEEYTNFDSYMEVQNSEGVKGIVSNVVKFNSKEFIPQVGKYVVAMVDLHFTSSEKQLCSKGDFLLVKDHTYGDESISVFNPYNKESGKCPIESVRVARKEEAIRFINTFSKACEINFNNVDSPKDKLKDSKTDESPFKEDTKNLLPVIKNKKYKKYEDLTFSYGTVCNLISKLLEDTIEIRENMELNLISAAIQQSKELESDLLLLYDPDFLEILTPDDEKVKESDKYEII